MKAIKIKNIEQFKRVEKQVKSCGYEWFTLLQDGINPSFEECDFPLNMIIGIFNRRKLIFWNEIIPDRCKLVEKEEKFI